jgi:hypothetical protein
MPRPILIVAHPGHELRLTAWMERHAPLLCILTDGSGGAGDARMAYSRTLAATCGAVPGPVFGMMPDRAWYQAILAADAAPFLDAATRIAGAAEPGALVVADPVEGYNPMHDLCAALADRVAAAIGGTRRSYALMLPGEGAEVITLDAAARERKRAAVAAYAPMLAEAAELLRAEPRAIDEERILPAGFDWPPVMAPTPVYEVFGQALAAVGVHREAIGYARHVRLLALRLRDAAARGEPAPGLPADPPGIAAEGARRRAGTPVG